MRGMRDHPAALPQRSPETMRKAYSPLCMQGGQPFTSLRPGCRGAADIYRTMLNGPSDFLRRLTSRSPYEKVTTGVTLGIGGTAAEGITFDKGSRQKGVSNARTQSVLEEAGTVYPYCAAVQLRV